VRRIKIALQKLVNFKSLEMSQEIIIQSENGVEISRKFENLQNPILFNQISKEIKQHVIANKLTVEIQKNQYPLVEAWQYAGALLGLFPRITKLECLNTDKEIKYRAEVEIFDISTGNVVTTGMGICTNAEAKKKYFEEYAIASMAQTRAVGKAFRILLGWIFKASGLEPTPAEEMDEHDTSKSPDPQAHIILKEYRRFVLRSIDVCVFADEVKALIDIAKPTFKEDSEVLDAARNKYKQLLDTVSNDE